MGSFSIWHWLVVLVIVLVLFGRGRVSEIMGDFGKGIKSFKEGMNDEKSEDSSTPPAQISSKPADPSATPSASEKKTEQS
ncbi:twin-arginine translocase TatA/TatE family subunit [Novosphingobium pentaromativorans]|uniref:Sec-independent protein translocase protein TatA n=1 Tax=Novosphingobium pentaromativorans US6-1 TaxID=1088721 RepID=G6ECX2_9SPHN|nr:twin-arginine translocase TatA/TatE family subunit [Novosphingobium pentaromativorans]AIT79923.1 preprotein translocase subunit TatA [Novosphingobium pentaromativorans US6-1]EHJ60811.1 sec-independent protein translocase protein TatA [Novosphingobium pentaromativorans US6-1]